MPFFKGPSENRTDQQLFTYKVRHHPAGGFTIGRLRKSFWLYLVSAVVIVGGITLFYLNFAKQSAAADILIGFNEGGGTQANDTNSTVSAGTITNAAWKTEDLCWSGKCLYFDGTGDYVSYSDDANLDMGSGNTVTIEGWFRTSDISSGTRTLISKYETGGVPTDGGYKITMNSSGYLVLGIDADDTSFPSDSVTSTSAYDDNRWHHFAAVKDGSTSITLYVDAVSVGTPDTSPAADVSNNDSFYIGIDNGSSNGWVGFIDEIKVYRTARTATEVKSDYLGETPSRGTAAKFAPNQSYLSNGLVGYWRMDEGTGISAADSSGNGTTGTITGAAWSNGKFSSGLSFDGSGDDVSTSTTPSSYNFGTGGISYGAWVNLNNTTYQMFIIDRTTDTLPLINLVVNAGGAVMCRIRDAAGNLPQAITSTTLSINTWYHLACVRDPVTDTIKAYINGVEAKSATDTTTNGTNVSSIALKFGAHQNGGTTVLNGFMDDIRIYNRALSPAEVATLYNWAPGQLGWWKMDEASANTCSGGVNDSCDSSGFGYDGAWNGNATSTTGKFGLGVTFDGTGDYVDAGDIGL